MAAMARAHHTGPALLDGAFGLVMAPHGRPRLVLVGRSGPALDPQVLAHALVACAEHFGRVALTDPGRFDPAHLIAQVRLILGAVWPPRR
jgi:hypothetical protein